MKSLDLPIRWSENGWPEIALGGQPYRFTPQPQVTAGADSLTITFQRPAWIGDVAYHAETGVDLTVWSDLPLEVVNPGADPERVRATYAFPSPGPSRAFVRLRFEK